MTAYDAVTRLAREEPAWLPAVRAALALTDRGMARFAGAWILDQLEREGAPRTWYPNFRRLVTVGVFEKDGESTRRNQRAYYRLPDPDGARRALESIDSKGPQALRKLAFAAVGRSGRRDLSSAAEEILGRNFPNR